MGREFDSGSPVRAALANGLLRELKAPVVLRCLPECIDPLLLTQALEVHVPAGNGPVLQPSWCITVRHGRRATLAERWHNTTISLGRAPQMPVERPLALLISHYIAVLRELGGRYSLHATALMIRGRVALIHGPPKSGKSALLQQLVRSFGAQPIATNYVLLAPHEIGRISLEGGTRGITTRNSGELRESSLQNLWSGRLPSVSSQPVVDYLFCVSSWPGKPRIAVNPDPVASIYGGLSQKPRLSVVFPSLDRPTWPFDSQSRSRRRLAFADRVASEIKVLDAVGEPVGLAEAIVSVMSDGDDYAEGHKAHRLLRGCVQMDRQLC